MSKAILVIDDPKFCFNCPLAKTKKHSITKEEYWFCGIGHNGEYGEWVCEPVDMSSEIKPDWCPLKPVPKKLEGNDSIYYQWGDYEDGRNHCIDCLIDG